MDNAPEIRDMLSKLLLKKRNYRQELLNTISKYDYVVFYGCGRILASILETWDEYISRKIDYCCDSDPEKWGKEFSEIKCISPDELIRMKDRCAIFVTIGNFRPVYDFLVEKGCPSVNQIYKYDLIASGFLADCNCGDVLDKLYTVYDMLEDQGSVDVFNAIVNRVLNPDAPVNVMLDVYEKDQYLAPGVISLTDHERLVDIGAFDGDTIMAFDSRTSGKYDKIYAFELDASNFEHLEENVGKIFGNERIDIFNLGAWDCEMEVRYNEGMSQSTIGGGSVVGHVVTLDSRLAGEKVTFIKMDIEGAESNALRGACGIIQEQKPTLAICIYHDFKHLWEIPLYIKSLVPEYKIYLRHHTPLEYETVCYAVL